MKLTNSELGVKLKGTHPDHIERDVSISVSVLNGAKLKEAGCRYALSTERVRAIVSNFCRSMNRNYFTHDGWYRWMTLAQVRENKDQFLEHQESPKDDMTLKVDELFNCRTQNRLQRDGIYTLSDLLSKTEIDLLQLPDLGPKSIKHIQQVLRILGYRLKE
jgi:hypothetical protein